MSPSNIVGAAKKNLTLENVLRTAMKTPMVKINREKFLRNELIKYCSEDIVEEAIRTNPAKAGISRKTVDKISLQVINYETSKVTGISVVASLPGGVATFGAVAADITSYFTFALRAVQKLAYLYGFEQFELKEEDVDSETMNEIMIFLGVMFGVQGASSVLAKLANALAENVAKKLAQRALTKGVIYPIVKKVAMAVGLRMTKQIFADSVASAIPIAGGALSGGLTFAMFRPCCMKLRNNLRSYNLCNPEFYQSVEVE